MRTQLIGATLICACCLGASAQVPAPGPQVTAGSTDERHGLALDLGVLGAALSYSKVLPGGMAVGVGAGGGAGIGLMLTSGEFTDGEYAADRVFAELLHGEVIVRSDRTRQPQFEGGVRAAWIYNPPTEYETLFLGVQGAVLFRMGRVRLGPRLLAGRMSEESGRNEFHVGLIPLVARLEWGW